MKTIQLNDMNETTAVDNHDAADVKGGPAYIKFGGVDGESQGAQPVESMSLNFTKIIFGSRPVKPPNS